MGMFSRKKAEPMPKDEWVLTEAKKRPPKEVKIDLNNRNTPDEQKIMAKIISDQSHAESIRTGSNGMDSVEQCWEDEYYMYAGGGKQWSSSFARRSEQGRRIRPNSEDNFIFNAITNLHSNVVANMPEIVIDKMEDGDEEKAQELTAVCQFNDIRNNFPTTWRKIVHQFLCYGPAIGMVTWDSKWMGGTGPNRWIGDIRMSYCDRRDIFFDPAIIDREERLNECGYIIRRLRRKVNVLQEQYPEKAKHISAENNTEGLQNEGGDPNQTYLYEYWHRGKPLFIPEETKNDLIERAKVAETMEQDFFKSRDLKDKAEGILDGIHVCYYANDTLLEYKPYIYDHGMYPIVYRVLYFDENDPNGFGEIRNVKIPQIMHNKADEIEISAMSREGLGGHYYNKGSVNKRQLETINETSGLGGVWNEVDNVNGIKPREGVKVPASVTNYKEHKQRMVETISSNTPVMQGQSLGTHVPFSTYKELGNRVDIKTKAKTDILKDFLKDMNKLRLYLVEQFYTDDRAYRITNKDGDEVQGTFNSGSLAKTWDREVEEDGIKQAIPEKYYPEFDVKIRIDTEKPNDRDYYTQTGAYLLGQQAMTVEDFYYTLDNGKFPPTKKILEHLAAQNQAFAIMKATEGMTPEQQQAFSQGQQQLLQQIMAQGQTDAFLDTLPDEVISVLSKQPDGEKIVQQLMQLPEPSRKAAIDTIINSQKPIAEKKNSA